MFVRVFFGGPLTKIVLTEQFHTRQITNGAPVDQPGDYVQFDKAVVLLDEIDKADPDVPNNLLVPLGSLQFQVEETITLCISARHAPLGISDDQ